MPCQRVTSGFNFAGRKMLAAGGTSGPAVPCRDGEPAWRCVFLGVKFFQLVSVCGMVVVITLIVRVSIHIKIPEKIADAS